MKFFLLFVMLAVRDATPQELADLTGKMFTFPQQTNTAHVRLRTTQDTFTAVTVCLRSFTDLTRNHALFSMAIPSDANAFLIFKKPTQIELDVAGNSPWVNFDGQLGTINIWRHLCATWDNTTGLGQVWVDGKPSSRKLLTSTGIEGTPSIILGQEQDSMGGRFEASQSFVGMMTEVHMWNYVLSPCEIQRYTDNLNFTPGNVINWRALVFEIVGTVVLEENQKGCV